MSVSIGRTLGYLCAVIAITACEKKEQQAIEPVMRPVKIFTVEGGNSTNLSRSTLPELFISRINLSILSSID